MFEKIKYVNHLNETIDFGVKELYVNANDLRDYTWSVNTKNNRISSFKKEIITKNIPIVLNATREVGIKIKNELFQLAEKDILALKHGKIVIGDYYLKCYVTEFKKKNYLTTHGYIEIMLSITTDYPFWTKDKTVVFRPDWIATQSRLKSDTKNLDFPFHFPFDFTSELKNKTLLNESFTDVNFTLKIYGGCTNPSVNIAGHVYKVLCHLETGEYLTIDSIKKTIFVTKVNGEQVNKYNFRNRDSYIFQKIKSGNNQVTWSGNFGFDITLQEERSEPLWI